MSLILNKKSSFLIELIIGIVVVVILVFTLRSLLILGETTFIHDNIYWNYPVFHFFAESIINGYFPYWDPFSHSGGPFYPILGQFRLLEPINLLTIFIGQFITDDIVTLFNWNRFIQSLVMAFGVYIVLRPWAKHLSIRLTLIPILLYSSFMLGSFIQDGIINQFVWIPYIAFFLLRIVYYKDYRWHNWFVLAGLIGLNWQSYFFTGTWVFLLFFLLGFLFFRRDLLRELFKARVIIPKLMVAIAIILTMVAPSIVLMLEEDSYVFPPRMIETSYKVGSQESTYQKSIIMPYNIIANTGAFSNIWNFIQIISPDGNRWNICGSNITKCKGTWGTPSEAYMYLGLLPWAIAILGMVAGRHDLKKVWLSILFGFGLLMLGPPGGLHRLLYYIYPPMWFVRHTAFFVLFFTFALLYFYILGLNHIFSTWRDPLFPQDITGDISRYPEVNGLLGFSSFMGRNSEHRKGIAFLIFSFIIVVSVYWMAQLGYPQTNYLFGYVIFIFIVGWFLRKDLGKRGLYISIIVSQIAIVLIFTTNPLRFLTYIIAVFGVPLVLFFFIKTRKYVSMAVEYKAAFILFVVFTTCLTGDLIYSLKQSSCLYSQEHPGSALNINTTPQKPFLPQKRFVSPPPWYITSGSVLYLSLLYRKSFVFSPLSEIIPDKPITTFEYALRNKKEPSFLLPKKYFELIHSVIPPLAMEEMFAVGRQIFQFKKGALQVEEDKIPAFLGRLGPKRSVQLLQEYVLVDRQIEKLLSGLEIPIEEYEKINKSTSDAKENKRFSYSIEHYEHNSFDMKVSTDKTGILYWADGYDKWWHAYIDGKEVPIYRANINFKAIVLPKGEHIVRFIYNPILFKAGLYAFYGSLIISVIASLTLFIFHKNT